MAHISLRLQIKLDKKKICTNNIVNTNKAHHTSAKINLIRKCKDKAYTSLHPIVHLKTERRFHKRHGMENNSADNKI